MTFLKQISIFIVCASVALAGTQTGYALQADSPAALPVRGAHATSQELQQIVAPIALYPDELAAEVLAASTYPDEVVEADRWIQQHSDLKGQALADEVDKQPWDSSVKALAPFPSVLANMDKNLSWTSSLGDAYVNQQAEVMDAIQVMRQRAQTAGNLQTTPQEKVTTQGHTIVIEPSDPEVVYLPAYNPWLAYGAPLEGWPGWYPVPGVFYDGPEIAFGLGFGTGFFGGFGWGWHNWGFDWHRRSIIYNHNTFISHGRSFDHREFHSEHPNFNRRAEFPAGSPARGFASHGFTAPQRGFGRQHGQPGTHSGAFSGFNHGGAARGFSARGHASFGGGFHGGGHGGGHH